MSLKESFVFHVGIHLDNLPNAPSGLAGQLSELSSVLSTYDAEVARIQQDDHLSESGRHAKLSVARNVAQTAVDQWRTTRIGGIDAQMAAQRSSLRSQVAKLHPEPTEFQVQNMVRRLAEFDPLEVEILYADASDSERRVIEAAADAIGRQPRKRGDQLVWEPLISADTVEAVVAVREQRANPQAVAALNDAQRIRNTYEALAGTAGELLRDHTPAV